jgi:hypothetical protein
MNADLIPRPDMLGLPGPAWLFQALMALTLALHWLLLGGAVGGTVVVLVEAARARRRGEPSPLVRGLAPFLPFFLSMAMTLGIAPLLFVQVLYGHLFYTANILLGWWWLGLLALVTVNFYLFWWAWRRTRRGERVGWMLPAVVLAAFVVCVAILSSNATLTQSPEAWQAYHAEGFNRLYHGAATFGPRVLMALSVFLAAGGLIAAGLHRSGLLYGSETDAEPDRTVGMNVAVPALVGMVAFGALLTARMPEVQQSAAMGGPEAAFFYVAAAALVASLGLGMVARRSASLAPVLAAGAALFVGLLAGAAVRDTVRRAALAGIYNPAEMPVHPEWLNSAVFAVFLLVGTGIIVWVVRLARQQPAEG